MPTPIIFVHGGSREPREGGGMVGRGDGARAKRPYRGTVQAEVAARTRQRILDAGLALASEEWLDRVTLDQVAARAGVTVQTIIRHFGTKDGLFTAAAEAASAQTLAWRAQTPPADLASAIEAVQEHYERVGNRLLQVLAQEDRYPGLRHFTDLGRTAHREWVARTFERALGGRQGAERQRLLAELVAVTDITFWRLLRRDLGLDSEQTALALRDLVGALLVQGVAAQEAMNAREDAGHI